MTILAKGPLKDNVLTRIPDNNEGIIIPVNDRNQRYDQIDSNLNLAETNPQTVAGPVDYTQQPTFSGGSFQVSSDNSPNDSVLVQGVNVTNALDNIYTTTLITKSKLVNSLSDLPAAVSGVIALLPNVTYVFGNDVNIGTDRFVLGNNTVVRGFESLNITLTYTGTGDMFTMVDTTNRISHILLSAVNGRLYNWTSTSGLELRVNDVQSISDRYGVFNGSSSILRFTNVSPVFTTDGLEFLGSWASVLWEVSGAGVNGGTFFDLGSATFNSILIDKTLMTLAGGTTFLSGLPNSGNIQAGGLGTVLLTRISGAGAPLSGITTDDALWEFFHNDEIQDTRPDALLSLQGNAIAETITTAGVAVKVTGNNTWVDERSSQSTSDNTGKSTYDGGKPVVVPITLRASVEPVSGTNKTIGIFVALNGVPIANSKATARVDAGDPQSITCIWQEEAQPGDFVEMYVSNETDTVNVVVSTGIIRIN